MERIQKHIIDKVTIEVNLHDEQKVQEIKNHISSFLHNKILTEIEGIFDDFPIGNQTIRFEKLDFDFNLINWEDRAKVSADLSQKLRQQLQESIGVSDAPVVEGGFSITGRKGQVISSEQNSRTIFLFFLEKGHLPWYGKRAQINDMLDPNNWQRNLVDKLFLKRVQTLMQKNEKAAERFSLQLTYLQVLAFVEAVKNDLFDKRLLETYLGKCRAELRNSILSYLLSIAVNSPAKTSQRKMHDLFFDWLAYTEIADESLDIISASAKFHDQFSLVVNNSGHKHLFRIKVEDIKDILLRGKKQNNFLHAKRGFTQNQGSVFENKSTVISKRPVSNVSEKEPLFFEKEHGEIAVQNAGQVLFLPFLKSFFDHFKWLEEDSALKDEHRIKAVQTVHFCATGREDFFEAEMILEKYICGLGLDTPIPAESFLNKEIIGEANHMLKEVLRHWGVLKNTSLEGLRQMFFQRDGKLIAAGRNFRLIIEQKPQDLLLERIPWNYSMIKLPWMKSLLTVEW